MQQSVLKIPVEIECRGCIMLDEVSVLPNQFIEKAIIPKKNSSLLQSTKLQLSCIFIRSH